MDFAAIVRHIQGATYLHQPLSLLIDEARVLARDPDEAQRLVTAVQPALLSRLRAYRWHYRYGLQDFQVLLRAAQHFQQQNLLDREIVLAALLGPGFCIPLNVELLEFMRLGLFGGAANSDRQCAATLSPNHNGGDDADDDDLVAHLRAVGGAAAEHLDKFVIDRATVRDEPFYLPLSRRVLFWTEKLAELDHQLDASQRQQPLSRERLASYRHLCAWLLRHHLRTYVANRSVALDVLQSAVGLLFELPHLAPPLAWALALELRRAFRLRASSATQAIMALSRNESLPSFEHTDHRLTVLEALLHGILVPLFARLDSSTDDPAVLFAAMLQQDAVSWCRFARWFARYTPFAAAPTTTTTMEHATFSTFVPPAFGALQQRWHELLHTIGTTLMHACHAYGTRLMTDQVPIGVVRAAASRIRSELEPLGADGAFGAFSSRIATAYTTAVKSNQVLQRIAVVLSTLQLQPEFERTQRLLADEHALPYTMALRVLELVAFEQPLHAAAQLVTLHEAELSLPAVLFQRAFLLARLCRESQLFVRHIWPETAGASSYGERLVAALLLWRDTYSLLYASDMTYSRIEQLYDALSQPAELRLLAETAAQVDQHALEADVLEHISLTASGNLPAILTPIPSADATLADSGEYERQQQQQQLLTQWLEETAKHLAHWHHCRRVQERIADIRQCLVSFRFLISDTTNGAAPPASPASPASDTESDGTPDDNTDYDTSTTFNIYEADGVQGIVAVEQLLVEFEAALAERNWRDAPLCTLLEQRSPMAIAQYVHRALVDADPRLFSAVSTVPQLLALLRTMPDDLNFVASIEIAMGKGRLDCPIDLWDEASCRPNEQIISMLRSVRSHLHGLLYYAERRFSSLASLLDVVQQIPPTDAKLLDAITLCNTLCASLADLLQTSSASGVTEKLCQLLAPEQQAFWVCSNLAFDDDDHHNDNVFGAARVAASAEFESEELNRIGALRLVWQAHSAGREPQPRALSLGDLLDMQSSLALSNVESSRLQLRVNDFIGQLSKMRQMHELLSLLHRAGHFDYQTFNLRIALATCTVDRLGADLGKLGKAAKLWSKATSLLMRLSYYLNHFTVRQWFALVAALSSLEATTYSHSDPASAPSETMKQLQRAISFSFPEFGALAAQQELAALCDRLLDSWRRTATRSIDELLHQLSTDALPQQHHHHHHHHDALVALLEATQQEASSQWLQSLIRLSVALYEQLEQVPARSRPVALFTAPNSAVLPADLTCFDPHDVLTTHSHVRVRLIIEKTASSSSSSSSSFPPSSSFLSVLSVYARAQRLPEREELCLVRSDADLSEALQLVHRWRGAAAHHRQQRVYTLAILTPNASYATQHKLVKRIQIAYSAMASTNVSGAQAHPMLFLVTESSNQHLCAQLASFRIPDCSPLPIWVLERLGSELSTRYSCGVRVYRSRTACTGKTFAIRSKATRQQRHLLHVPISTAVGELLPRLMYRVHSSAAGIAARDAERLVHIELTSTVSTQVYADLFELLYLGGLRQCTERTPAALAAPIVHSISAPTRPASTTTTSSSTDGWQYFVWPTDSISVAVELAARGGIPFADEHMGLLRTLPTRTIVAAQQYFCADRRSLHDGMGSAEFATARSDGTQFAFNPSRQQWTSQQPANAFERLQYVCTALKTLGDHHGSFPYVFEAPELAPLDSLRLSTQSIEFSFRFDNDDNANESPDATELSNTTDSPSEASRTDSNVLSGARCFSLLLRYSQLQEPVSLRCVWNFVNCLYFQLRSMHDPESPINSLCRPDAEHTKFGSLAAKSQLKGDLVALLIRTASDFVTATRRVAGIDRIVISGFSRQEWNGIWTLAFNGMEHDGQGVFHYDGYHLYYSANAQRWRISSRVSEFESPLAESRTTLLSGPWVTFGYWKHQADTTMVVEDAGNQSLAFRHSPTFPDMVVPMSGVATARSRYRLRERENELHERWDATADGNRLELVDCADPTQPKVLARSTDSYLRVWEIWIEQRDEHGQRLEEMNYCSVRREYIPSHEYFDDPARMFDNIRSWNSSNHDCLLFDNSTHAVFFLSLEPQNMANSISPRTVEQLTSAGIQIGVPLEHLERQYADILGALTGVTRSEAEAKQLTSDGYCVTGDNLLKMLAITLRLRCGIPVALQSECGTGKSTIVSFLCRWLGVELIVADLHGGTTVHDIVAVFRRAFARLAELERENTSSSSSSSSSSSTANPKREARVFVFLDEINACSHMGLLCEIVCHRSFFGERIPDQIYILTALNPYRRMAPHQLRAAGLVFADAGGGGNNAGAAPAPDPMRNLVYRVHPVPRSLADEVFDFGSLDSAKERGYLFSMASAILPPEYTVSVRYLVADLLLYSQSFIRELESDVGTTSLRDVSRSLHLIKWFTSVVVRRPLRKRPPPPMSKAALAASRMPGYRPPVRVTERDLSPLVPAVVMGLALSYYYRLSSAGFRARYWMRLTYSPAWGEFGTGLAEAGFYPTLCTKAQTFEKLAHQVMARFCRHFELPSDVALNQALTENLFVTTICILNRIPVFLVGMPGTSKTLTLQIIASNLQGKQSPNAFWRSFPTVHVVPYQCSPMSDSNSIRRQFDTAVRYQQSVSDCIAVLVLDEVGLAEFSPAMPLKVLHSILYKPPIAIVGLSNWALDPAKMNRAIGLQRPAPSLADIRITGLRIAATNAAPTASNAAAAAAAAAATPVPLVPIRSFAAAFHSAYTKWHSREAEPLGMRDFYAFIKLLKRMAQERLDANRGDALFLASLAKHQPAAEAECGDERNAYDEEFDDDYLDPNITNLTPAESLVTPQMLLACIHRSFGGSEAVLDRIRHEFQRFCPNLLPSSSSSSARVTPPRSVELIRANLSDCTHSRNLMVLTEAPAALPLMFDAGLLEERTTEILAGPAFAGDRTELFLLQQITLVKSAMAAGRTVVLINNDSITEPLYDVLNQRYVTVSDADGGVTRMLRLAIGNRSQLCAVADGFKVVMFTTPRHAASHLPAPLVSRFERQLLRIHDMLDTKFAMQLYVKQLEQWIDTLVRELRAGSPSQIFCGFHARDSLPCFVIRHTKSLRSSSSSSTATPSNQSNLQRVVHAVQQSLLQIATPAAVVRSDTLRQLDAATAPDAGSSNYFVRHANLVSALWFYVHRSRLSCAVTLTELLTFSPRAHLHEAFPTDAILATLPPLAESSPLSQPLREIRSWRHRLMLLHELHSEQEFSQALADFLLDQEAAAGSSSSTSLLLIQIDPAQCSEDLVARVRYLCSSAVRARQQQQQPPPQHDDEVTRSRHHIVLVVHLPPGLKSRPREHQLYVLQPFESCFVDDLRLSAGTPVWPTDLVALCTAGLAPLVDTGFCALRDVLRHGFRHAVTRYSTPAITNDAANEHLASPSFRLQQLGRLLHAPSARFLELIEQLVHEILTRQPTNTPSLQLSLVLSNELVGGTFVQSLLLAIESLVLQALAHALRALDTNYNLALLDSLQQRLDAPAASPELEALWFMLAKQPNAFDGSHVARSAVLGGRRTASTPLAADNLATCGAPLIARFPFSYAVMRVLNAPETRKAIELQYQQRGSLELTALERQLEQVASTIFGTEVTSAWAAAGDAYLHDFVALSGAPFASLAFEHQLQLYKLVLVVHSGHECTVGSVHVNAWLNEARLFAYCSALAALEPSLRCRVLASLISSELAPEDSTRARRCSVLPSAEERVSELDCMVLDTVLAEFWSLFRGLRATRSSLELLAHYTDKMHNAVLALMAIVPARASARVEQARRSWAALKIASSFVTCTAMQLASHRNTISEQLLEQLLALPDDARRSLPLELVHLTFSTVAQELKQIHQLQQAPPGTDATVRIGNARAALSLFVQEFARQIVFGVFADSLCEPHSTLFDYLVALVNGRLANVEWSHELLDSVLTCTVLHGLLHVKMAASTGGLHSTPPEDELSLLLPSAVATLARSWQVATVCLDIGISKIAAQQQRLHGSALDLSDAQVDLLLVLEPESQLGSLLGLHSVSDGGDADDATRGTVVLQQTIEALAMVHAVIHHWVQSVVASSEGEPVPPRLWRLLRGGEVGAPPRGCTPWVRLLLLRALVSIGGYGALLSILLECESWQLGFLVAASSTTAASRRRRIQLPSILALSDKDGDGEQLRDLEQALMSAVTLGNTDSLSELVLRRALTRCYRPDSPLTWSFERRLFGIWFALTETSHGLEANAANTSLVRKWLTKYASQSIMDANVRLIFTWLVRTQCALPTIEPATSMVHAAQQHAVAHAAELALEFRTSWLGQMLLHPASLVTCYLPGMPLDDSVELLQGTRDLGWYRCPNGHRYTVGNCTWPMEESVCTSPGCGAVIGGRNHQPSAGNKRLDPDELIDVQPGYTVPPESIKDSNSNAPGMSPFTWRLVRIVIHGLMLVAFAAAPGGAGSQLAMQLLQQTVPDVPRAQELVAQRFAHDWRSCRALLCGGDDVMLLVAMHSILHEVFSRPYIETEEAQMLPSFKARKALERRFEDAAVPWLDTRAQAHYQAVLASFGLADGSAAQASAILGAQWEALHRVGVSPLESLFCPRRPITLESFATAFAAEHANRTRYPLLAVFLRVEHQLPYIRFIADILAWHALLFSALSAKPLQREEALQLRNIDFVRSLPLEQQPAALELLHRFCVAFNGTFHLVPMLFECQPNPFLTADGRVDLSGTGTAATPMSECTPLSFSLPYHPPGTDGDASGICTIQLLNALQQIQDEALTAMWRHQQHGAPQEEEDDDGEDNNEGNHDEPRVDGGVDAAPPDDVPAAVAAAPQRMAIPSVSILTPLELVRQRIIEYDRERDFMPLVRAHERRSSSVRSAIQHSLTFDLAQLERSLCSTVLRGKTPIMVSVRQYQYAEMAQSRLSNLALLKQRVPQEELALSLLEALKAEIETGHQLSRLLAHLDSCIAFLVAVGGSGVRSLDGRMSLGLYLTSVLMVPAAEWEAATTKTITQHVCLCHLVSVYMQLGEMLNGDPLDEVCQQYRQPLSPELLAHFRLLGANLDRDMLLPVLRDLMISQLCTSQWPPQSSLKEYLLAFADTDLDSLEWFEIAFPDHAHLSHAMAVYGFLRSFDAAAALQERARDSLVAAIE